MLKTGIADAAAYSEPPAPGGAGLGITGARGTVHTTSLVEKMPQVEAAAGTAAKAVAGTALRRLFLVAVSVVVVVVAAVPGSGGSVMIMTILGVVVGGGGRGGGDFCLTVGVCSRLQPTPGVTPLHRRRISGWTGVPGIVVAPGGSGVRRQTSPPTPNCL